MRLLVTVTFNPNQLRAHIEPILDIPEVAEVVLVTDAAPPQMPKLRAVVPPAPLVRLVGRAAAKLVVCCVLARRLRPDWVIGFHLVPHGVNAVLSSACGGAQSMYVQIGGQEWREGGWRSNTGVLRRLPRPSPALERLLLAIARRATVTVTMGTRAREELLARGFHASRVEAVPASVDPQRFRSAQHDPIWDVITVAALVWTKRLDDLVRAVAALVVSRPSLRVAVVGEGPLEDDLKILARDSGVAPNVEFLGFRDDVHDLYAKARVFALPSDSEGLPISLLEAMSSRLPVVVSDVGEIRDVVRHGVNGFLYRKGDVQALARYIALLLADTTLCRRLGEQGAEAASRHAARAVIMSKYRAILSASFS